MLIVLHYVLMLHHYILMLLHYILYDTLSYKKMEIFEPDWLHIKIYIAKTRASAIQVKLESGRNVSRSPSLHCWISLCQTTPISPAYCSSLFRRLGILFQFYRYRFVICWFYLILQAGAFKWQFFLTTIGFGASIPLKNMLFCPF